MLLRDPESDEFPEGVVTDKAAHAAHKMLLGNREPKVRSRLCALLYIFNGDSIRERIQ
jgi:hypothetical protein